MTGLEVLAGLAAAGAVAFARPAAPTLRAPGAGAATGGSGTRGEGSWRGGQTHATGGANDAAGLLHRFAWPVAVLAGAGVAAFVGGAAGLVGGLLAGGWCLRTIRRSEDPVVRRRGEEAATQLPALVLLLGAALRSGAPPATALAVVCTALPGAAAGRLEVVRARLALGLDPVAVWDALAEDAVLAPLARTLCRAAQSGVPVADAVERLAVDLADRRRAAREDRARAVGVRAALPLGLCLLPAFLLLGIVPLVAGLLSEVTG